MSSSRSRGSTSLTDVLIVATVCFPRETELSTFAAFEYWLSTLTGIQFAGNLLVGAPQLEIRQSTIGKSLAPITAFADSLLKGREETVGDIHRLKVFW